MSDAVIGLIGVLVGGALSTVTSLLVERAKQRAAEKAEEAARRVEQRQAVRLLVEELEIARIELERLLRDMKQLRPDKSMPLPEVAVDRWAELSQSLARTLSTRSFVRTMHAYEVLGTLSDEWWQDVERGVGLKSMRTSVAIVTLALTALEEDQPELFKELEAFQEEARRIREGIGE